MGIWFDLILFQQGDYFFPHTTIFYVWSAIKIVSLSCHKTGIPLLVVELKYSAVSKTKDFLLLAEFSFV